MRIHIPIPVSAVTSVTILLVTLVSCVGYSQSRLGRAELRFAAGDAASTSHNHRFYSRSASHRVDTKLKLIEDQIKFIDPNPTLTSRHFHSGSNTLRLAYSEDGTDVSDVNAEPVPVIDAEDWDQEETLDEPAEILEPQPWMGSETRRRGVPTLFACGNCDRRPCRCPQPRSQRRTGTHFAFLDALYLRPGNVDFVYAVEQTECDPQLSSPTGQVGAVRPEFEPGIRIGIGSALDSCTSVNISYSQLESHTTDLLAASGTNVLHSRITHPSTGICADDSVLAFADYDIDFYIVDIGFRRALRQGVQTSFGVSGGIRYAHLDQEFLSQQTVNANGTTTVVTDIDFDGAGVHLGFDGQWRSCSGLKVYGRGMANFIGGEFKADYLETSQFGGSAAIASNYEDYRVMSILEAEFGLGWQSKSGQLSAQCGYQVMGWFDAITTAEFIDGVHRSAFDDFGDIITFSGFVARAEVRF